MRKTILALAVFTTLLISACGFTNLSRITGSGNMVTEERNVSGFTKIDLGCSGDVILTQGNDESLTIEGEDNIIDNIVTEVRGDTLYIDFKPNLNLRIVKTLKFYVTLKDIEALSISGSGNIESDSIESENISLAIGGSGDMIFGQLEADQLDISIGGSGDVNIDSLTAESINTKIGGSGDLYLSGTVTSQDLSISGSGRYHCADLSSENAEINVSGSGTAEIWVLDSLDIHISGSGDIRYYGRPMLDQTISGSGDIVSLGKK